jgi:C4-dicarboxylate-specific signal transduction histidine kinase
MTSAKMAALGEMSAGMAHEINNPLTILLGHAHAIRAKLEKSPEHLFAVDSSIKSIENTVRRISKIIKGLRTFARDAANDPFRPAAVYRIVEDTLSLCHNRAHNLGIEVKIENEISDLEIDCREVQISQVLLNLLNNAIDAISNQEDKWIRVKISQIEENYLQIQVEDSGHGIPKEIRDKMMQPFFTTKEVGKGTGLGLSIVKGIIESHSGQFKYNESSANTCFQIVLPIYQLSNEEIIKNAA